MCSCHHSVTATSIDIILVAYYIYLHNFILGKRQGTTGDQGPEGRKGDVGRPGLKVYIYFICFFQNRIYIINYLFRVHL